MSLEIEVLRGNPEILSVASVRFKKGICNRGGQVLVSLYSLAVAKLLIIVSYQTSSTILSRVPSVLLILAFLLFKFNIYVPALRAAS